MKLILPPGVSAVAVRPGLAGFASVVGTEWVLATDEDRDTYLDAYAPGARAVMRLRRRSPRLTWSSCRPC